MYVRTTYLNDVATYTIHWVYLFEFTEVNYEQSNKSQDITHTYTYICDMSLTYLCYSNMYRYILDTEHLSSL